MSRDSALCSILAGSNSADEMCFEKDEPKVTESGTTMMKWLFWFFFVCLFFWIIREIADGLNLDKKKKKTNMLMKMLG